jgi:(p)ppGpp synthase/HD superfamily hydrolase
MDKAGEPYIGHVMRVAARLPDDATDDERVAALLHDAIEDAGETMESLRAAGVSPNAVAIIDALTRREGEFYSDFIARVVAAGRSAVRVKLADIGDNTDPGRTGRLDAATRDRLQRKYAGARAKLEAALL